MVGKRFCVWALTVLSITAIAIYVFACSNANEKIAIAFLTSLYTSNTARWQLAENVVKETRDTSIAMEEYFELYAPLTTIKGYEALVSNRVVMMSDMWALENSYTLTVKHIALTKDVDVVANKQYRYAVTIQAVPDSGSSTKTVTAEGILTLKQGDDGKYKVHALRMITPNPYIILESN